MNDYKGPERRSDGTPSTEQMLEAVKMLSTQYEDNSSANRALAREVGRRKREGRWIALGVTIVITIVIVGGLVVRHNDLSTERQRRDLLASQIFTQRDNLIAGCERANESRRTDRETIEIAFAPSPIPPALPPELRQFYLDAQEQLATKREELLSRPGVQIIDCPAAYPPPSLDR